MACKETQYLQTMPKCLWSVVWSITTNKQCHTVSSIATKWPDLARQIKQVVKELQVGLIVVASVCDQGTNNRHAIKLLLNETRGIYLGGMEPKENVIFINGQEIIPLHDPPHLLKGIRNNLLPKKLIYKKKEGNIKVAKWLHLKMLYDENPGYKCIRLIPKLTEFHVNPEKLNKMKVKLASQIFSRTVAIWNTLQVIHLSKFSLFI